MCECAVCYSPQRNHVCLKLPLVTWQNTITLSRTNSLTFAQGNHEIQMRVVSLCCIAENHKSTQCVYRMYIQYLKGGDLVFEHFLGFVEVWQHVLRLSAVDSAQFGELPLVSLGQLLFVSPEQREEWTVEFLTEDWGCWFVLNDGHRR